MEANIAETLVLVVHVLACIAIIGLVLIQQGKGAEAGSGFGSGSSGTVFGSGGAGNFLTKTTTSLAIAFFLTSFALAFFAKQKSEVVRNLGVPQVEQVQEVEQAPEMSVELPDLQSTSSEADSEMPALEESSDAPQEP